MSTKLDKFEQAGRRDSHMKSFYLDNQHTLFLLQRSYWDRYDFLKASAHAHQNLIWELARVVSPKKFQQCVDEALRKGPIREIDLAFNSMAHEFKRFAARLFPRPEPVARCMVCHRERPAELAGSHLCSSCKQKPFHELLSELKGWDSIPAGKEREG